MNTTLTIKNFRVFDENGVDVQLSPITILTGCNSSGKSSIVKSIFLLYSFLKQIKRDHDNGEPIRLDLYKLDFNTYPNNLLGRYDKIVNNKSESKRITFAYTIYSLMLSKEVNVEFVFNVDKNDELNNGFLESFTLSTEDGIIYSSGKNVKNICNLNIIKKEAVRFILAQNLIQDSDYDQRGIIKEEIGEERFSEVLRYWDLNYKENIVQESECKPEVFEWTMNNSSYFYIPLVELLRDCTKENLKSKISDEVFSVKM